MNALLFHETANEELEGATSYLELAPSVCECEYYDPDQKETTAKNYNVMKNVTS
jgi:hypothetical protein